MAQQDSVTPAPPKKSSVLLILFGFILVAVVVFVLIKVISSRLANNQPITLNYWGLWESDEVMKSIISDWEKEHPKVKINYSFQSVKEYRERLQSALARNEGPDIFRFHLTWVPLLKNELSPLPASVMSPSQFETSFYPIASSNLRSGNSFLGVPLMVDTLSLYYNEDIFKAAGKTPPTNWQDLRQTAYDLTVRDAKTGVIQTAGVALGTTNNVDHWSDILGLMMLQQGVDLRDPSACSKGGETETCLGADALTFYTIFSKSDQVWDETLPPSTLAFATGKVAMYFGPSWRIFDIKAINPSLNFKVVPAPQLGDNRIAWGSFWVEGVSQKSKYQNEAWEFLNFLSSKENLTKLYQSASNTRLFGEPYSRTEMASMLNDDPLVSPFINQAPYAQTWYLCSNTFDNGLNDRMIKYFEDAVNGVNQGRTSQEVLKTTSQGVSQLLSQYGVGSLLAPQ